MLEGTRIYGGFTLPPSLAHRVIQAVREITSENLSVSLSHVSDDDCEVCRSAAKPKEERHDAAGQDRPGREWAA
jgi:hypothetical protein